VSPNAPASSISTDPRSALIAAAASARALLTDRYQYVGLSGYVIGWLIMPLFWLSLVGLVYRGVRPDLLGYVVVGTAANSFIGNALYGIGEMLDRERVRGTLVALFLAPCPRISWLTGFSVTGLIDTCAAALATLLFGRFVFGVRFNVDAPAFVLSLALFVLALWGLGLLFMAVGLVSKRSNDVSNLVSPFLTLLGGVFYPIAILPLPLQIPARALPIGYGVQAMSAALLHRATLSAILPDLLPLAGFALGLPLAGILAFGWVERGVRARGELDLY
jgi:ABC-2 type transport system permease protein